MKVWDISRTLSNDLAEWPGDEPCRFRLTREKAKGASVNLGAISMSVHNGTLADARCHFDTDGESIQTAPLGPSPGPAPGVDRPRPVSDSHEKHRIPIAHPPPPAEHI